MAKNKTSLKDLVPNTPLDVKIGKELVASNTHEEKYLYPSYTGSMKNKDLVFKGISEVVLWVESPENLEWCKKQMTVEDITLRNSAKVSKAINPVRVEETEESIIDSIHKEQDFGKKLKLIGKLEKVNAKHPLVIKSKEVFGI